MSFKPTPDIGEGEEYELRPSATRRYEISVDAKIVKWRTECFEALGFAMGQAMLLALRRDVDRSDVERMIKAGAKPEHVMAIFEEDE